MFCLHRLVFLCFVTRESFESVQMFPAFEAVKIKAVGFMPQGSLGMGEPDKDTQYTTYTLPLSGQKATAYHQVGIAKQRRITA